MYLKYFILVGKILDIRLRKETKIIFNFPFDFLVKYNNLPMLKSPILAIGHLADIV